MSGHLLNQAQTLGRQLLAHGLVGLAEATGRHWGSSPEPSDLATMTELVTELAWRGLRGRPESEAAG